MNRKLMKAPAVDLTGFTFDPLDKRHVPPKPQHGVEEKKVAQIQSEGNLIISRKRDGYFHDAVFTRGGVKLYTRTRNDVTDLYPEVIQDLRNLAIPYNTIISCELIVDENGLDAFPKVGKLAKTERNRLEVLESENLKASLMPFNVLVEDGQWLHELPNEERFIRLNRMFGSSMGSSIKPFELLSDDYETAKSKMRKLNWEGLVLYHRLAPTGFRMNGKFSDPYRPYGAWKKKDKHEDDFVVIEKIPSAAKSWPGALKEFVIVQYDPKTGQPVPCGKIGNGFTVQERWDFMDDKKYPLPFVVQVRFSDRFIDKGKGTLRFGDFVTVRYDKSPDECIFDKHNYKHTPAGVGKEKKHGK